MIRRTRHTNEQQQEKISRGQFHTILAKFGWVADDFVNDLGEDIHVRIYEKGASTGIHFDVQLKSTENIEKHRLKSGEISYSFEVKDLEHWDIQGVPVILVVWDINREQGWWIWVKEALVYLNKANPTWQKRKKATIRFPFKNTFEKENVERLRDALADHFYPIIAKDRPVTIEMRLSFPPTQEGKAKLAELEKHFDFGDEFEITGEFIEKFELPDWWQRLFGEMNLDTLFVKWGPAKGIETHPFQIDFISDTLGTERLGHVVLGVEKSGKEQITLSNENQKLFVTIRLMFNRNVTTHETQLTIHYGGLDGYDARKALRIQKILSSPSRLRMTNLETGVQSLLTRNEGAMVAPHESTIAFVDNVCKIQDITSKILRFPEDGGWTIKDEMAAEELVTIFDEGRTIQTGKRVKLEILKPGIAQVIDDIKAGKAIHFRISQKAEESHVEILGEKIDLGPMIRHISGNWQANYHDVERWLAQANEDDVFLVRVGNAEYVEELERWKTNLP